MLLAVLLLACITTVTATVFGAQCDVLYQLNDMTHCRMEKSFEVYRYYGCSCSGTAPNKPLDGIDKCCEVHTDCYNSVTNSGKCQNQNAPFFCYYQWECMEKYPACKNDNKCLQSVCECDEQFINCLAKYPYPNYARKCPYYEGDPILKYLSTPAAPKKIFS